MENTSLSKIETLVANHKKYFSSQQTKNVAFRIEQLKKLKSTILNFEKQIAEALYKDLRNRTKKRT